MHGRAVAPEERAAPVGRPQRRRGPGWSWASGLLLLAALILVVRHFSEEQQLATLARDAEPSWLALAALLQLATYPCAAAIWYLALRGEPARPRLVELVPLGLAKLFTDQAVPSAGVSGTLLVVGGLIRRGVPRGRAVATMLVGLLAFYIAYAVAVAASLLALSQMGELDRLLLIPAALLGFLAAAVPVAIFGLGPRLADRLPRVLKRVPMIRATVRELAEAPPGTIFPPRLAAETAALRLAIFALDAATLGIMLLAVGVPASPSIVFASFVLASVVATLTWVPGGLGTFEGSCVALLHSHGIGLEAALAATLLLRGFTFWLPMLPGLWVARRELVGHAPPDPWSESDSLRSEGPPGGGS